MNNPAVSFAFVVLLIVLFLAFLFYTFPRGSKPKGGGCVEPRGDCVCKWHKPICDCEVRDPTGYQPKCPEPAVLTAPPLTEAEKAYWRDAIRTPDKFDYADEDRTLAMLTRDVCVAAAAHVDRNDNDPALREAVNRLRYRAPHTVIFCCKRTCMHPKMCSEINACHETRI